MRIRYISRKPKSTIGVAHLGLVFSFRKRPLKPETEIRLEIVRDGLTAFTGTTNLTQLKRSPESLVEYLFRDNAFPNGCVLLTGTGIVPPDDFTLQSGDGIRITIDCIGTLTNVVE